MIEFKSFYKLVEMTQKSPRDVKILMKNVARLLLFLFFCCLIEEAVLFVDALGHHGEFAKSFEDVLLSIQKAKRVLTKSH